MKFYIIEFWIRLTWTETRKLIFYLRLRGYEIIGFIFEVIDIVDEI